MIKYIHFCFVACPAAVAIEAGSAGGISTGVGTIPLSAPEQTSGLTVIPIKISPPIVTRTLTIRLYKPTDSSNIGLSQIKIMANTTFGETNSHNELPCEAHLAKSSLGWLRLLHHCVSLAESFPTSGPLEGGVDLPGQVVRPLAAVPGLIPAVTALLFNPTLPVGTYALPLERVLLTLGVYSHDSGELLINTLIQNTHMLISTGNIPV